MTLLKDLIQHEAPLITGANAIYPYKATLARKFRFTSRFGEEVSLHRVSPDKKFIMLPRAVCPIGSTDERTDGVPVVFAQGPTPRDYQVDIYDEIAQIVKKGLSGQIVAGTGTGKTSMGCHAAFVSQRKTLIIVPKDDIFQIWIDAAKKFLGLSPNEIGVIRGDKCVVEGRKFVVAMIQSLCKEDRYPDWILKEFGLVICDESHRVNATQFSYVADLFPARIRLALSATPERSDGKELLVAAHFGPVRARLEGELLVPKVLRFQSGWECPKVLRTNPKTGERSVIRIPHEPGKTAHIEKMLAADKTRNHMIAELIATAHQKDRKIIVFSTLHDHLKTLHRACRELYKISGRDMGFYIGATTKAEKEHRDREKGKPIIFTTYVMAGEGTDIPWLDTCILAMPRANVKQPAGRVRREYPDKGDPVLMDVIDYDSPVFSGYSSSRLSWYHQIGAKIVDMN